MIYFWTGATPKQVADVAGYVVDAHGLDYEIIPLAYDMTKIMSDIADSSTVVAMGGQLVEKLSQAGYTPKNASVTSVQGKTLWMNERICFIPTFSPNITQIDVSKASLIRWAAKLACRVEKYGVDMPETGEYKWVEDLHEFCLDLSIAYDVSKKPQPVAWDLETMGLWPFFQDKQIVSSQWCKKRGQASVVYHYNTVMSPDLKHHIGWLLTSPKIKTWGSNLKYDMQWVYHKWGIRCTNFSFDTTNGGSILDENRANSLNQHAKDYTNMGGYDDAFNAEVDKSHMELVEKPKLLEYGGGDADASFHVARAVQTQLMQDPQLLNLYRRIIHPALIAFNEIEIRGEEVDLPKYLQLEKDLLKEIKALTIEMMQMIPMVVKAKHSDNLSLTRPALLRDFLFTPMGLNLKPKVATEKTGEPSTSIDDHLSMFRDHPKAGPFIKLMEKLNSAKKTLSTYVVTRTKTGKPLKGFLAHLRPDGKFHATYILHAGGIFDHETVEGGTVTGRLSAKNPARQTLPKHTKWAPRLRECFPAPKGFLCWQLDFSQGELRVAADVADDQNMIKVYAQGSDLHTSTGALVAGITLAQMQALAQSTLPEEKAKYKEFRSKAKPINFGFLYGMQAPGFVEYARKSYGTIFDMGEAIQIRDDFFEKYNKLLDWHADSVAFARQHGYVRSPLGRKRNLPLIKSSDYAARSRSERQAINSPVQGTLSDLNNLMISEILAWTRAAGLTEEFWVVGATHDSANGYVRAADAEKLLAHAQRIGNSLSFTIKDTSHSKLRKWFDWDHKLPFPVDAELGETMASLEEVKLAA